MSCLIKVKVEQPSKVPSNKIVTSPWLLGYAKQSVHESTLRNMYLSIVEPNLSYCCSVLGCCVDTKLNTMQKLQNRSARIVTNNPFDSSAAPLLQRLGWLTADRPVHRKSSSLVYKSADGLAPSSHNYLRLTIGSYKMLNAI